MMDARQSLPQALLLDMDGTLTAPLLDFPAIKREMGIGQKPILEALAGLDAAARAAALAVLHRHEQHAAENSTLNAGCHDLLNWLARRQMGTALITRNSRLSAQTVCRRHDLRIGVIISREDAPFKPQPDALQLACRRLGVDHAQAWMVGDGQYDVEAGLAAGMKTVWISHRREKPFAVQPWQTVAGLPELLAMLQRLEELT